MPIQPKPITILLVTSGWFHPSWLARLSLAWSLSALPGCRFHRTPSLESLPDAAADHYAGIVLYLHQQKVSQAALDRLGDFIQAGGGLLAVHSASASFKQEKRFTELLGGRFVSHGPIQTFPVQPVLKNDPVFGRMDSFQVRDELYRHEWDAGNQIHFGTPVGDDGPLEPVVWTRQHGAGRVCYCSLGHRAAVLVQPPAAAILRRGLAWVCSPANGEQA